MNKLDGLKARFGILGFGLSTTDNELKEKLTRLEDIRTELKDVYKKLEKKCLGECALFEMGAISATAFTNFGKNARAKALTETEYADVGQLAEKASDVQTFLVNSDNAHYENLRTQFSVRIRDFVKGPVREARYIHVEYQQLRAKLDSVEKQIASESKKQNSQKLPKMKEEEYQLKRDVDQKRDAVLQKMDSVLSEAKDFELQIMQSFLQINLAYYTKLSSTLQGMLSHTPLEPFHSPPTMQAPTPQTVNAMQSFTQPQGQTQTYTSNQSQTPFCATQPQEHMQTTAATTTMRTANTRPRTSLIGGQRTFRKDVGETMVQFDEALKMIDEI